MGDGSISAVSVNEVSSFDWAKGNKDAAVTLIEYSDFQCPACRSAFPQIENIVGEFGEKMQFVYRHYPISQIHKNAEPAARAAEAAGKQGKFWSMYEKLFERQNDWKEENDVESIFADYATELNLNVDQFRADYNSRELKDRVKNDYDSGTRAGVNSTPTFFLNGQKIKIKNYDELRELISKAIGS